VQTAGTPRSGRVGSLILRVAALLLLGWGGGAVLPARAGGPADAVVTVVALDDRGTPTCQGLGVVISQGGYILTSAAIFAQTPHGVVKTAAGSLHVIRDLVRRDDLQDLALVQVEADNFTVPPVRVAPRLASQEEVAAPETRQPGTLHKGRVAKTLPLSPRLVLVKLEPESLTGPPGTPLFNRRGELAGMLHTFAPDPAAAPGLLVWLAHSRTHTWREPELTAGPMPPPIRGCADFWAGVTASLRQEWPVSRDKFSAALALTPNLAEASYGRGVARYHLGDDPGAAADLTAAAGRLPGYALAYLWLGKTRDRQRQLAAARQAYERAAAADPDLAEAWFHLGLLAFQAGRLTEAQRYLERAGDDVAQGAQRWWYLGVIARSQQRWDEARRAFNHALTLDPELFPAQLDQGKLLLRQLGQPQAAITFLQQAVRLEPRHGPARYYLGLAHAMSWNPAGAWEQYFALQEYAPELAVGLAQVLERN